MPEMFMAATPITDSVNSANVWLQFIVFATIIIGAFYALTQWGKKPILAKIDALKDEITKDIDKVKQDVDGAGANVNALDSRVAANERSIDTVQLDMRHFRELQATQSGQLGRIEELARASIEMAQKHRDEIMSVISNNREKTTEAVAKMRERVAALEAEKGTFKPAD